MTEIDFSQLMSKASSGFEPVPADTYDAEVVTAEAKTTANGKHMIKLKLAIIGGPYNGRTLFDNLVLSPENPNALGYFFEHMAALGLDSNFFAANPSMEHVAQSLGGRQARIKVGIREYQGNDTNDVQKYSKPTGPQAAVPAAPAGPAAGPSAAAAPSPLGAPGPGPAGEPF